MGSEFSHASRAVPPNQEESIEERRTSAQRDATLQQLRVLQAVSDTALAHLGLEDLLRESLRKLREVLEVDNVAILLLSEDGSELTLHTVEGPEEAVIADVHVPFGKGVAGTIAATKAPMIINDLPKVQVANPFLHEHFSSLLGVPLMVQGHVLGVIHIDTILPHHFTEEDARLLEMIAYRLALAVDHARLFQAEQQARAEATRRASQLEAIFEAAPVMIALFDAQGTMTQLNQLGKESVGSQRGGESLAEVPEAYSLLTLAGEPVPVEELPVARALRGEVVSGLELVTRDSADGERFLLVGAAPFYDAVGQVEGAVSVTHNITSLRQAERQAAEHASRLQATFDAITDSLMVLDTQGRIVHGNETFRAQVERGFPPEYMSLPLPERARQTQLFNEQGRLLTLAEWPQSRVLAGEVLTSADIMMHAPDGSVMHLNVSGAPIRDAEGHITGAVLLYRDVTERRLLEQRTHRSLEALLEMAELLVKIPTGPDLLSEPFPNSAGEVARQLAELTCAVLGCSRIGIVLVEPETELMRPLAVVGLSPEQEREWWASQSADARLGDSLTPELVERLRQGESVLVDMRQPPFNEQPNPYHITTFLTVSLRAGEHLTGIMTLDHSGAEHHYTEQELGLASAVGTLTAVVLERERLLRQREEARANELALRESNRQMNEFLSIVSHELRTPLTSVSAYIQRSQLQLRRMLASLPTQEAPVPDLPGKLTSFQETLERAGNQIKRLNRLIGDLLDVARIESGRLELASAPCDLAMIVREAVQEQRLAWPSRAIGLEHSDEHVPVVADAERIGQVVSNYLTNALKYSAQDQPVQVSLRLEAGKARVLVRDQGPGLSPEQHTRIWERFHRAPGVSVQSGSGVGLGLGLYICRIIIEQHHGKVGVQSAPGEGSTFWFTLPLAQD
jgi:PAS domain S-box-containing protein